MQRKLAFTMQIQDIRQLSDIMFEPSVEKLSFLNASDTIILIEIITIKCQDLEPELIVYYLLN